MENQGNRVDVKIVRSWEGGKIRKLVASSSYAGMKIVSSTTWEASTCTKRGCFWHAREQGFFVGVRHEAVDRRRRRANIGIRAQNNQARTCSGGSCVLGGTTNSSSRIKTALWPIRQIIDNGLVRFGYGSFKMVNFQRPDWVFPPSSSPGW